MPMSFKKRGIPFWGERLSPVLTMLSSVQLWAILVVISHNMWHLADRLGLETEAEVLVANLDEGPTEDVES